MSHRLLDERNIASPALLFFPDIIRSNIAAVIAHAGDPNRLRPHVKTHKTVEITKLQLAAGVTKHKCATIAEAEMLAMAGASDVLLAYPLVGPNIARFVALRTAYPATQFSAVVDHSLPLEELIAAQRSEPLPIFVDIDMGMNRTGAPFDLVPELARRISATRQLRFAGFHAYDGHANQESHAERESGIRSRLITLLALRSKLEREGIPVLSLVCGGTPGFPIYAKLHDIPGLECSPGTYVLHDHGYGSKYPDLTGLAPAAILLSRVISRPTANRVTLDLGNKAVAADPLLARRIHLLDFPPHTPIMHSEEHYVVETAEAERYRPGDVVYAVPGHVCPTVALHREALIVEHGTVTGSWLIAARDRKLHIELRSCS